MNRRSLMGHAGAIGASLATTVTVSTVEAATPVAADAALLQLGHRFEAAWKAEREAWDALDEDDESSPAFDHACNLSEKVGALADQIERSRATTLPGLLVKGRALRWNRGTGEPVPIEMFDLRPLVTYWEPTEEQKLIVSVLGDLHAMTGGDA